jgi:integrase
MARQRGTGRIWLPKGSSVYWCAYSIKGRKYQINTKERNRQRALDFLKKRLAAVTAGTYTPDIDKVTVDELVATILLQHKNDGTKSLDDDERKWKNRLQPFFGGMRAVQVSTDSIRRYIAERQTQVFKKCETGIAKTPANATINRELALLRAAINLGRKGTPPKVHTVPYFPMLDESDNIRKGFLKDEQIQKLAEECGKVGLWLRTLFEVGVQFGWRVSEPLSLRVSQIDFSAREIHLTDSKNGNGRIAYILDDTLLQLLKHAARARSKAISS